MSDSKDPQSHSERRFDRGMSNLAQWLAGNYHDLKTPLANIEEALNAVRLGVLGLVPQDLSRLLELIGRNTTRVSSLLDKLMEMARLRIEEKSSPAAATEEPAGRQGLAPEPDATRKRRILIIDDEQDLVHMMLLRLERMGFLVEIALNGRSGLEKAAEFNPDIILLDIVMPEMDGWEVCRHLRADPRTKEKIIVLFTALPLAECEDKSRAAGADKIVSKPFNLLDITDIIKDPRMELEAVLRGALERGEFELFYQPQVSLSEWRISGFEALVRWRSPERGLVGPDEFIGVAEETGLIIPLGLWILRKSCEQSRRWRDGGLAPVRIGINISGRQFEHPDLVRHISEILADTGAQAGLIELEITETFLMEKTAAAVATMNALKDLGIKMVIDDFGTGYSSLKHLKLFPAEKLKIEKSFIEALGTPSSDEGIVRAIIAMAHNLNLQVLAEGVEEKRQLDFLRSVACDEFQGYFFSPPVNAEEATRLLISTNK